MVVSKEYISIVERTATPHCLTKSQLTLPLPALSAVYSQNYKMTE